MTLAAFIGFKIDLIICKRKRQICVPCFDNSTTLKHSDDGKGLSQDH